MRVTSYREIKRILDVPEISRWLFKTHLPIIPIGENCFYLRPNSKGLLIFIENQRFTEMHAAFLAQDRPVKQKFIDAFKWMHENRGTEQIYGQVHKDNKLARYMAHACGWDLVTQKGDTLIYGCEYGRNW